jgi:hypothetical protein
MIPQLITSLGFKDFRSNYLSFFRRIDKIHELVGLVESGTYCPIREYIKKIYKMKSESPKGSSSYLQAKIILNSLYGNL